MLLVFSKRVICCFMNKQSSVESQAYVPRYSVENIYKQNHLPKQECQKSNRKLGCDSKTSCTAHTSTLQFETSAQAIRYQKQEHWELEENAIFIYQ